MAVVLREEDVRILLTMPDTVAILEQAFGALADGNAINLPRHRIKLTNGVLNMLAAAAPTLGVLGYKSYTAFREGVRFVVMLYSAQDGKLLAIIEADWLGRMRTGGTSGLATKYLALPDATIVGLIGSGNQAVTQLLGICAVRPVTMVYVYSRNAQACRIFCDEMMKVINVEVRPVPTARQVVEVADILITATSSPDPVFQGEWVKPGCHINAIGSNWHTKREIDLSTLQRSYLIVTDSREQAQEEAGDFIIPADEDLFDWNRVFDLSEVVGRQGPQRNAAEDITLYKGLGTALEDIATAAHVYEQALVQGFGEELLLIP
ncbi:MAG TPA: ornithine cyclodeaminase [Ktedonobacter sp.]|jgi:ornithine cyclodeaminase/alanine dehydrogenase-like protein (mu-crystallin family)|nr:ornithine cyclodeaminase [Ktedonobacter sp.]HAT45857.1 ornithine cyclodeaminase [Ktedonobacter sp.]HBE24094.1 ornithine cyclodeaminase [Ktedonobacter sp.]HBE29058.1 ornithine cyclodeaminase [Ktedonobacter sp.]HCF85354.1 ornithine cyclodeaminase [Ktedonobacter sp.]